MLSPSHQADQSASTFGGDGPARSEAAVDLGGLGGPRIPSLLTLDSCAGIRTRSDQSVTSGSSLLLVQAGPNHPKVVHPCGSQPDAPWVQLIFSRACAVHGSPSLLPALLAFGAGSPSKIIPRISRVRAAPPDAAPAPGGGPGAPLISPIGLTAAGLFAGGEVSRADSR